MRSIALSLCLVAVVAAHELPGQDFAEDKATRVLVDSLDLSKAPIRRPRAGRGQTAPPPPLVCSRGGKVYEHAVPLTSDSDLTIDLFGRASRFDAIVGIDDSIKAPSGSVIFGVWVDGKKV